MEIMTPAGLVEEILDKLPMEVWRKDIKICDPCLKSGIFLIEAAIRLIKQFGSENYKYILDNNLYGYCDSARVKQLVEACFGQEMPNIKIIEGI